MQQLKSLWQANRSLVFFIALMFVFRSAVADWNYVPSSSMNPTLVQGDRVVVNKLAYSLRVPFTLVELFRWSAPSRGDVITFDSPKDELNLIKRVVAIAGDSIEMKDNVLFINGQEIKRQLLDAERVMPTEFGPMKAEVSKETNGTVSYEVARLPKANYSKQFNAVQVPQGHVMVMGDSRDNSNDSRYIGFIDVKRITGQAVRVALSHDVNQFYLPRSSRWWLPLHS
jgi:signal peptidase I